MIKICKHCSGINLSSLKEIIREDQMEVGCIEVCKMLPNKVYGYINDELVYADSEVDFFAKVREALQIKE